MLDTSFFIASLIQVQLPFIPMSHGYIFSDFLEVTQTLVGQLGQYNLLSIVCE